MRPPEAAAPPRVAIILHSGAYDRVSYALSMARVALAMGCQVRVLLTHEALRRFTRGHLSDLGEETPAALRQQIQRGLASGGIQPLEQDLADAKRLGLEVYACPNAMANLNISHSELSEQVDGVLGLAAFMDFALGAASTWYV